MTKSVLFFSSCSSICLRCCFYSLYTVSVCVSFSLSLSLYLWVCLSCFLSYKIPSESQIQAHDGGNQGRSKSPFFIIQNSCHKVDENLCCILCNFILPDTVTLTNSLLDGCHFACAWWCRISEVFCTQDHLIIL